MQDMIIKILNSSNVEQELRNLSFEEKMEIVNSSLYAAKVLYNYLTKNKIAFFNREETIHFFEDVFPNMNETKRENFFYAAKELFDLPYGEKIKFTTYIPNAVTLLKNPEALLDMDLDRDVPIEIVPDEIIEQKLNQIGRQSGWAESLISSFKSDEYKIKYLNKLSPDSRATIISKLSDETKKKFISPLRVGKAEIISSLNDKDAESYYNAYKLILTDEEKEEIISRFKSNELIKRYIGDVKFDKGKASLIRDLYGIPELSDILTDIALSIKSEKYILECITTVTLDNKLLNQLLNKINNSKYAYDVLTSINLNKEDIYASLFPKLSQGMLKRIANDYDTYIPYTLLLSIKDDDFVLERLKHASIPKKYNDDMLPLFQRVANYYHLNLDHLIALAKKLDCTVLSKVENNNIYNAINLDDENFNKYLELFNEKNIVVNRNAMSALLNSFLNKKFSISHPDKIQIFINTIHAVADNDIELAINNINEVLANINIEKYNISAQELTHGIISGNEDIIVIFNKMTYEYLNNKRNDYVNESTPEYMNEISSPQYDINDLVKQIIKITPTEMLMDDLTSKFSRDGNMFTSDEIKILSNKELLMELVKFKKNPQYDLNPEYKKYFKSFNSILKICYVDYKYHNISKIDNIKVDYKPLEVPIGYVDDILSYIDPEKLKEYVFSNPEMEQELQNYLARYGVLGWSSSCSYIASQADLDLSPSVIGTLISNFAYIMDTKKEKEEKGERFTLVSEVALASCLDSDAEIYSYLFNKDNYRLIASNPGPNSSPKSREYRLKEAVKDINIMHNRNYITVPPVNEDFKLKSGKSINICLGNTNDPINLTYGERTGACMRIGGAGASLFNFCLGNENGFHISFNNPQTGNLISRVSCYRNGNTLFFNQVRNSLDKEYNNEMIRESCGLIAKRIIDLTKDSNYPIVNVVTSDSYAYGFIKTIDSGCDNPNKGFFPPFYTDINSAIVVVATANENGELLPIELGPNKCEKYEVGRAPIREYNIEKASTAVSHIEVMDDFLSGVALDEIEVNKKDVSFAYVGEDWYVAATLDGEIINYVQRKSRNREQANQEMQKYLIVLQEAMKYSDITNEKGQVL